MQLQDHQYKIKLSMKIKILGEKNSYEDIVNSLTKNLSFRYNFRRSYKLWDFNKVKIFGKNSGFTNIIKSKYLGSVSEIMRRSEFD